MTCWLHSTYMEIQIFPTSQQHNEFIHYQLSKMEKKKSGGVFICSIMLKGLFQEYFGRRSKLNFSISHTIQVRLHTSIGNKLIDQTPKVLLGANPDEAN